MINIVYSTDENYCRNVAVSMMSLFENNKLDFHVYIIEDKLKNESKEKLVKIANKYEQKIEFLDCNKLCKKLRIYNDFPRAAYGRLFLGCLNIDKILYLDSDTYVNEGILELYNTNISDFEIAGVQDDAAYYLLKKIGMDKTDRYINSGVLLINLKKWREDNVEGRILKFVEEHNGKVNHADQGIINGVCKKNIFILNPKFNMMPEMIYMTVKQVKLLYNVHNYYNQHEINNAVSNPVIIHYIEKFYSRPWKSDCTHPMKEKYLNMLKKTGFNEKIEKKGLNKKILIRKKIFEKCPFLVYVIFEKILNLRRRFLT